MPPTKTAKPIWPLSSPPLQTGERIDAAEFLSRYEAARERVRAELIEGVVFMAPAANTDHARPQRIVATWLGTYEENTPAVVGFTGPTIELGVRRVPEPDEVLLNQPPRPSQARIGPNRRLTGCPDLVVEVANSSARLDLGRKRRMYSRAGVREYLVWRVARATAVWWTRAGTRLTLLRPDEAGVIRSRAFPGLWLDTRALARGSMGGVLECLRAGLASAEYAVFAEAGR